MAEFCTCGSMMINGSCTNKNCDNKAAGKTTASKSTRKKAASSTKSEPKSTRTRKSSKCVTYNLYESEEENVN